MYYMVDDRMVKTYGKDDIKSIELSLPRTCKLLPLQPVQNEREIGKSMLHVACHVLPWNFESSTVNVYYASSPQKTEVDFSLTSPFSRPFITSTSTSRSLACCSFHQKSILAPTFSVSHNSSVSYYFALTSEHTFEIAVLWGSI